MRGPSPGGIVQAGDGADIARTDTFAVVVQLAAGGEDGLRAEDFAQARVGPAAEGLDDGVEVGEDGALGGQQPLGGWLLPGADGEHGRDVRRDLEAAAEGDAYRCRINRTRANVLSVPHEDSLAYRFQSQQHRLSIAAAVHFHYAWRHRLRAGGAVPPAPTFRVVAHAIESRWAL
jgi:hypothetical protein